MSSHIYAIRNMEWDDLPLLARVGQGEPNAWSYHDLARAMESPYALCVVALFKKQIIGYLVYVVSDSTGKASRKQGRLHLTVGLLNMVVDGGIAGVHVRSCGSKSWRRQGVARFLIHSVENGLIKQFSKESTAGRLKMTATVPESRLDVQLFFKACGFCVPLNKGKPKVEPSPFDHCRDDGYVFERRCEWPAPAPKPESQPEPAETGDSQPPTSQTPH